MCLLYFSRSVEYNNHLCLLYFSCSVEYNNHLFLSSEVATTVWNFYTNLFGINSQVLTVRHMLTNWWREVKGNTLYSWLLHILPSIIIWHIWKVRNKKEDLMIKRCLPLLLLSWLDLISHIFTLLTS